MPKIRCWATSVILQMQDGKPHSQPKQEASCPLRLLLPSHFPSPMLDPATPLCWLRHSRDSAEQTQCTRLVICWLIKLNHLSTVPRGHLTTHRRREMERSHSSAGASCQTADRNQWYKTSHSTFFWMQPQWYLNSSFAWLGELILGKWDNTLIPVLRLKLQALFLSKLK